MLGGQTVGQAGGGGDVYVVRERRHLCPAARPVPLAVQGADSGGQGGGALFPSVQPTLPL